MIDVALDIATLVLGLKTERIHLPVVACGIGSDASAAVRAIKAGERTKLQQAKEYLEKNPGFRLLLEGHCDWRGTAEYNLGLGDRRANSVKKYLQSIGVAADRVETLSKGSLEAAKNADEATMAKDRRVNLIVVNPAVAAPKPL